MDWPRKRGSSKRLECFQEVAPNKSLVVRCQISRSTQAIISRSKMSPLMHKTGVGQLVLFFCILFCVSWSFWRRNLSKNRFTQDAVHFGEKSDVDLVFRGSWIDFSQVVLLCLVVVPSSRIEEEQNISLFSLYKCVYVVENDDEIYEQE